MNINLRLSSKIYALLLMVIPLFGISQTKNVISVHRVFPKMDKVLEFEKAIAAHAQKYHKGDSHWRVFAIQSGPDIGGFHITEGPTSWEGEDSRGDMGAEHTMDWNKNVAIHLTNRQSGGYSVYLDSLSTVAMGDYSDKIQIAHWYPKLGQGAKATMMIRKLKAVWTADGSTVAVYSASGSGPTQFTLVTRYKQGLKERAGGFRKPFRTTYDAIHGSGAYDDFVDNLGLYMNEIWNELLFLRKDLSSK